MTNKAISIKEYTDLLVFIVQLLRCNNSCIVNDAPAARLESGCNPSSAQAKQPMVLTLNRHWRQYQ
ncbi:MAG: hypothetical protein BECKG1743E_GA0114224_102161, partial [Candidatus Kentron sp. G]